jgi:ribosome modulation factor
MSKSEQDKTYEDGRAARRMDVKRESCPFGASKMQQRAFWLAGWHDMDMELESK